MKKDPTNAVCGKCKKNENKTVEYTHSKNAKMRCGSCGDQFGIKAKCFIKDLKICQKCYKNGAVFPEEPPRNPVEIAKNL